MIKDEKPRPLTAAGPTVKSEVTHTQGAISVDAAGSSARGARKHLEDEHLILPSLRQAVPHLAGPSDLRLYAIFDGHGGKQSATFCKENLGIEVANQVNALSEEELTCPFADATVKKIVTNACQKLDNGIATSIPNCKDGATAVILLLQDSYAWAATLGDSAAFLCTSGPDGDLHAVPLSEAHKPWVIREKERIIKSGGMVENGRVNGTLAVTRSLGDIHLKRYGVLSLPTFTKFRVTPNRDLFVLMGCDGVWAAWAAADAVKKAWEFVKKENRRVAVKGAEPQNFDLKQVCKDLVKFALIDKEAQDNLSLIFLLFGFDQMLK